jgi:transcriptional regulator with XRE-family HTH domain
MAVMTHTMAVMTHTDPECTILSRRPLHFTELLRPGESRSLTRRPTRVVRHLIWYIIGMSPGTLIRATRERHRLTQTQLALRAGTSQNAVSRAERDEISPSVDTLQRLLAAMGVRRIEGDFDSDHLADSIAQTMSERLERSLAWNRFAGQLAGVARSGER